MSESLTQKIKEFIVARGLISPEQLTELEAIEQEKNINFEELLVNRAIFSEEKILSLKSEIFSLPAIDLTDKTIDPSVLNLVDAKVAENYQLIIFERLADAVKVGLVNPADFRAREAIEFLAQQNNLRVEYFVISAESFKQAFRQYGNLKKEIVSALASAEEKFFEKEKLESAAEGDLVEMIKSAPVAKIVSVIIQNAVDGGASDIHIEPGRNEARVRYRVDGILRSSLALPNYLHNAVVSRIKVLADLKLDETRLPQDGRIRMSIDNKMVDLRVSILPMLDAEKVVIRILDTSAGVPNLAELGFLPYHVEMMERNINKPHGLFLLTGPTGSGKTTTLYSLLNILNSDKGNITTLEDPIEYYIDGVNQSQIRPEIDFTFAKGLRAILRQDPNIIMVGEIRDNETAELVIHAALTGHLVFSTLHTNNAWGAVPRLIDMHVEPFLLASTANLVMAQRLVRKICADCRQEVKLPANLQTRIDQEIKNIPAELLKEFKGFKYYRGTGCSRCGNSGYVGRSVVGEMFEVDDALRQLIAVDFTMEQVGEKLKKQRFINIFQDGIMKALKGITTIEEVLRIAQE